jgi:predicted DNA-binding transcriptional regulator YafY
MLFLFQSRRRWTVRELAEELDVSPRTVHRYITMLEELGIPLYSERGPYGGFSLLRSYKLPPIIFTPEEASVLYMGARLVTDFWGKTFQDAATGVTAKLDNVLPDDLREEARRAQQSLIVLAGTSRDYTPYHDLMATLRDCMANDLRILIRYHSFARIESDRKVDPLALSYRWGNWYLIGYCHLRRELRTFRIDRITKCQVLKERFERPEDFDPKAYLEDTMQFDNQFQVVVRMSSEVAERMNERAGDWMRVENNTDGSVTVRFDVDNLDWAAGWVLSWGKLARALEPPELIRRVVKAADDVVRLYGDAPNIPT